MAENSYGKSNNLMYSEVFFYLLNQLLLIKN